MFKTIVFFGSFLFHELGHAFMLRKYKVESQMLFYAFGGLCIPVTERNLTYKEDILVSLAGPIVNLLLALLAYLTLISGVNITPLGYEVLNFAVLINLVWGIFNLIPLLPMDGSSALKNLMLWAKVPKAYEISFAVSFIFLCIFAVLSVLTQSLWNLCLVAFFAWENYKLWKSHHENKDIERVKFHSSKWPDTLDNSHLEKLIDISAKSKSETAKQDAAYSSAIIFAILGNFSRAQNAYNLSGREYPIIAEFLNSAVKGENTEQLCNESLKQCSSDSEILFFQRVILHNADPKAVIKSMDSLFSDLDKFSRVWSRLSADMHYKKDYEEAAAISLKLHDFKPNAHAAYNAACSLCQLGKKEEAVKYVKEAVSLDPVFKKTFEDDKDLDSIRGLISS